MRVGIKYCGGCNPRFNRKAAVKLVMDAVPSAQYVDVTDDGVYDVLLVIGGCSNSCADIDSYSFLSLISVWAPSQVKQAIRALKSVMKLK